jgi:rhodanese-related sulfurtransferase
VTIHEVTVDELASALQGGARLIDVREPTEYDEAHVPGAILVPLGTVADRLDAFDADATTYVICRSGARSMKACRVAAESGLRTVNVAGGTLAWIASGRNAVSGGQPA